MRRQRDMAQMKEEIKTPEKELNKMEISNLCCSQSRLGRSSLDSGRWEKMCGSVGMFDMPSFMSGQAMRATSCTSLWWEAPTCLSTKNKQSWEKAKKLYNIAWFCTCEPTSHYGKGLSDPVSRLWEHNLSGPFKVMGKLLPLVTQTPEWGSQTASIYPTQSIRGRVQNTGYKDAQGI